METVDIRPKTILGSLRACSRAEVFREMVDHLVETKLLPQDLREPVIQALEIREQKLTTAIGNSLALPHASIPHLPTSVTALARSVEGIDCQAPDGRPVHLFYLVLVPTEDYAVHLRTVAAVTRFFRDPGIFEKLHACGNDQELMAVFS
ncbi:MAG: PTS sugar transporter subunit IIA [Candidatus Methylacidiphilales bacterium]|nr:PTS sugar transporter subunit IIA [Candidatus Methylacidiphilales bacterium]